MASVEEAALVALVLGFPAAIVVATLLFKRSMRYYRTDGALVEAFPDPGRPFTVEVPAGGPLWIMMRYSLGLRRRSGRRATYGLTVEVTARRDGVVVVHHQRAMGSDARRVKGVPEAPGEPAYLVSKVGLDETRTSVLARLPAGGPGVVEIAITLGDGTSLSSVCVFAKPPRA